MGQLFEDLTVQGLTTCAMSIVMVGAIAYMAVMQIEPQDWFLMLATGVFSSHFTGMMPHTKKPPTPPSFYATQPERGTLDQQSR